MDFESKLSNVAFGGNWAEELVEVKKLTQALADLEWAVQNSWERDVHTEAVRLALDLIEVKIEKGAMHRASFEKAMRIENQTLRQEAMQVSYERMKSWSGI